MSTKNVLADLFKHEDQQRQEILNKARFCAALSKPWVLPPEGHTANDPLPEAFQSLAARGMTNMEGRLLMALFGTAWFKLDMSPEIAFATDIGDDVKQNVQQALLMRELMAMSVLESAAIEGRGRQRASFRSRKRMALSQILITGDTLESMTDDYRIKVYRRDMYTTRRDSEGDVMHHVVREHIDPLTQGDEILSIAGLNAADLLKETAEKRMRDLFTRVQWQPRGKNWLIEQELNGQIVNESTEPVSPFFSTPFELAPGEHYGRGFIELMLGDVRSYNEIREKILDFAALASKHLIFKDLGSNARDTDLQKPTGSIVTGRVQGGNVQDVAFLSVNKINDFSVVMQAGEITRKELNATMLMESELQPRGDRVTAYQSQRIAMEVDGALGGLYAPVADDQQVPTIQRTFYQLERDKLLPTLPPGLVNIKLVTGIAALGRSMQRDRVLGLTQVIAQLGPSAMAKINMGVLVDVLARYEGIHEPGLIKSEQQMAEEQAAAQQAQAQQAMTQKGIDVAGNVAESALMPQQ